MVKEEWIRGEIIGRGSYGTVSLAVSKSSSGGDDNDDGRKVFAVKSVEKSASAATTSGSPDHKLEALENEIRILRSLSSPYVVEYLGDGDDDDEDSCVVVSGNNSFYRNLYLEYLTGGTVADLARNTGGADVDEQFVKSYTFCLVSALKYIHSKGIVHCDIKADNFLVVSPNSFTAKLVDFGSAIEIHSVNQEEKPIIPRGSPMWMAPEVMRAEYQGPQSDIWSLGCTIIEMVTGKPAWEDKGAAATMFRIGYSELLPLIPTQLSESGQDFLKKCLRREPKERWTADQLLKHPFISKLASPENSGNQFTPRCVLDWFGVDSDDEEEERNRAEDNEICVSRVKDRIRKLTSSVVGSPKWESDGWTVVRSSEQFSNSGGQCRRSDEGREEGTSWEYSDMVRVESEIVRPDVESTEIGAASGRTSGGEYFLDSSRSPLQEEFQNQGGDDVVSSDLGFGRLLLLLLLLLLANFSIKNAIICTQIEITILLRYTSLFL